MEKIKVIAFFLGGLLGSMSIVYGSARVTAGSISYEPLSEEWDVEDVNSAIRKLRTSAGNYREKLALDRYTSLSGQPIYYEFGEPDDTSSTDPINDFDPNDVFIGLYSDDTYGICVNYEDEDGNIQTECFRPGNELMEQKHMEKVFRDGECAWYEEKDPPYFYCENENLYCDFNYGSIVYCESDATGRGCDIGEDTGEMDEVVCWE